MYTVKKIFFVVSKSSPVVICSKVRTCLEELTSYRCLRNGDGIHEKCRPISISSCVLPSPCVKGQLWRALETLSEDFSTAKVTLFSWFGNRPEHRTRLFPLRNDEIEKYVLPLFSFSFSSWCLHLTHTWICPKNTLMSSGGFPSFILLILYTCTV